MESRQADWRLWIQIAPVVLFAIYAVVKLIAARRVSSALEDARASSQNLYSRVKERATAGDAESQFLLANFYEIGLGLGTVVPKDPQQALLWYRKAAQQGHPWAQRTLDAYEKTGVLAAVLPPRKKAAAGELKRLGSRGADAR